MSLNRPDISLYVGKFVEAVNQSDILWQWEIVFDDGTRFVNKSRDEIIAPLEIVGGKLKTYSMSLSDTTLHFEMPNGFIQKMSFNPTQYAIHDPAYGGEVYPQWPEELEEAGITSHPEEGVSAEPGDQEAWEERYAQLDHERSARQTGDTREFLEADQNEN